MSATIGSKNRFMLVLGIETSCDETAVALVNDQKEIKAHLILSQLADHIPYGGVVPEVAARAHLRYLPGLIRDCMQKAGIQFSDLDAIAATAGPGLIGGVMVGVMIAKAIASVCKLPFLAINHLLAHALTVRLTTDVEFPYLLLLLSGGHCQLVIAKSPIHFHLLGSTLDDAVGECFDKVAKMLELPYPGGVHIERLARGGDANKISLSTPLLDKKEQPFAFSFSGLKSAVKRYIELHPHLSDQDKRDVSAALQMTIGKSLVNRAENALRHCLNENINLTALVIAGGVAANQYLRQQFEQLTTKYELPFIAPPPELCTDNGAMVAWAGIEKMRCGLQDGLDFKPRPRWPLDE
jgi:N6-L-threonylcarbamoyladenine synthase